MTVRRTLHPDAALALGQKLVEQRKKLGKSQQEIADLSGISRGYYRTLEIGRADYGDGKVSNPTMSTIIDVTAALDLQPSILVDIALSHHGTVNSEGVRRAPTRH